MPCSWTLAWLVRQAMSQGLGGLRIGGRLHWLARALTLANRLVRALWL